jgi:hypothetical protein
VLDRAGLEAAACSCYRADNAVYQRLLGSPDAADPTVYTEDKNASSRPGMGSRYPGARA